MTADLGAVAAATSAVLVAGRRVGTAVLVDGRYLLTACHVLRGGDVNVEVEFPSVVIDQGKAVAAARRVPLEARSVDAAVLDLGPTPPPWLPPPISLWPAGRQPARVALLGFPLAERAPRGVWREYDVSGPVAGGTVQLTWLDEVGSLPGQSGGPVVDVGTGALVGLLVEGSERGVFDRLLPLSTVRRVWAELPRPWLMAGSAARDHFVRRAHGQRSVARGGDVFRGREVALDTVRAWLSSEEARGRVLVVTGQPGAGKSAVVARVTLQLETERVGPGLAFHAHGATLGEFLSAVSDLVGVSAGESPDALIAAVSRARRGRECVRSRAHGGGAGRAGGAATGTCGGGHAADGGRAGESAQRPAAYARRDLDDELQPGRPRHRPLLRPRWSDGVLRGAP